MFTYFEQLGQIEMYHVYVDGFLRTTVRASDKTRALVEGVDCARVRIKNQAYIFLMNLKFRYNFIFLYY